MLDTKPWYIYQLPSRLSIQSLCLQVRSLTILSFLNPQQHPHIYLSIPIRTASRFAFSTCIALKFSLTLIAQTIWSSMLRPCPELFCRILHYWPFFFFLMGLHYWLLRLIPCQAINISCIAQEPGDENMHKVQCSTIWQVRYSFCL